MKGLKMKNENENRLKEIKSKSTKMNKSSAKQLAKIIAEDLSETGDFQSAADWLLDLNYQVSEEFYNNNYCSSEQISNLIEAYLNSSKLLIANYMFNRIYIAIAYALKQNSVNQNLAQLAWKTIDKGINNKEVYSKDLCKSFITYISGQEMTEKFEDLCSFFEKEYRSKSLKKFINYINSQKSDNVLELTNTESILNSELSSDTIKPDINITSKKAVEDSQTTNYDCNFNIIISELKEYKKEFDNQLKILNEINSKSTILDSEFRSLKTLLEQRDSAISELKEKNSGFASRLVAAEEENSQLRKKIQDEELEIEDLTKRLKDAYDAKNIKHNQELEVIRREISDRMKNEYLDYMACRDKFSEDNFNFLLAVLEHVFRILKRNGFLEE